jgi:hypothetical protein
MMNLSRTKLSTTALLAALVLAPVAFAQDTLNITYFTIGATDQDANHLSGGVYTNEVQNTLGADGLPVLNTAAYGCTSDCISVSGLPGDVLPDGEITYWSPSLNNGGAGGTSDVTETGTGVVDLPFTNNSFFAPNGTGSCDGPAPCDGYQAAILSGTLDAPTAEDISFSIGSDDMAFVYLNGGLVCDDGGVHGSTSVPCTTSVIPAGDNSIELFYVDINQTQAALDFSITTTGVTTTAGPSVTPEPSSFLMLGTGLLGAAAAFRRRFARSPEASF